MPKISELTLINPTIDDIIPVLDEGDETTKASTLLSIRNLLTESLYPKEGFMWNGKISTTVSGNNLTLAIKTYAGVDPSTNDFVTAMIGGVVRKISAPLSVTLALGTSWMNLGGTELANCEVDLFAYLGWNAVDGVTLAFARISGARSYGDFASVLSTTNEKWAAVSNRTNASSTDPYRVIGRFAATLASGTFYWSKPSDSNTNLIQEPILYSRLLSCFTAFSGFSVSPTYSNFYQVLPGNQVYLMVDQTVNGTSNATGFTMTAPFANTRAKLQAVIAIDNGAQSAGWASFTASNIINLYPSSALGNWNASGGKRTYGWSMIYNI